MEGKQENTLPRWVLGYIRKRYRNPPAALLLIPPVALTTICLDIDVLLDSEGRNEWYFHHWLQCICDTYIKDPSGVHISGACRDGLA